MASNAELLAKYRPDAPALKPAEPSPPETLFTSPMPGEKIQVLVTDGVYIHLAQLPFRNPEPFILAMKHRGLFKNPGYRFAKLQGRPLPAEYLEAFSVTDENTLRLPKGDLRGILDVFHRQRIPVEFVDKTITRPLAMGIKTTASLPGDAGKAVGFLSGKRFGILAGGQGEEDDKRVAAHLIAFHGQTTLIVVKRRWQLYLWRKVIMESTSLTEVDIGLVGDGHKTTDRPVTVGIDRSLYQFVPAFQKTIGFLIVDTCDRVNVKIFFRLVWRLPARFLLGIATQTKRRDGLTELMHQFMGRAVAVIRPPEGGTAAPVQVVVTDTPVPVPEGAGYEDAMALVCGDDARTRRIFADILSVVADNQPVVVVSPRIQQLQTLQALLMKNYRAAELITGKTSEKEIADISRRFADGEVQVVLCTTKTLAGAGLPKVPVVFVAGPFQAFETAAGIAKLLSPGGMLFDYQDGVPVLSSGFSSRIGFYRRLKFTIKTECQEKK